MSNFFSRGYDTIYITYVNKNSIRKRYSAKLMFTEKGKYYFRTEFTPDFVPPKKNIEVEIHVYTPNGIYTTVSKLKNFDKNYDGIMYEIQSSEDWRLIQMRKSSRKKVKLPVTIKLSSEEKMEIVTEDLALGGISFFSKQNISSLDKKLPGILTLTLPENTIPNFETGTLNVGTKFVREIANVEGHFGEILYSFKFMNLSKIDENILKEFLIKIN